MSAHISIGVVLLPAKRDLCDFSTASRIVGFSETEICLIPIDIGLDSGYDPSAPFLIKKDYIINQVKENILSILPPSVGQFNRGHASEAMTLRSIAIRSALSGIILNAQKGGQILFNAEHRRRALMDAAARIGEAPPPVRTDSENEDSASGSAVGMHERVSWKTLQRYLYKYLKYNFDERAFESYGRTKQTKHPRQTSLVRRGRPSPAPPMPQVRDVLEMGVKNYYVRDGNTAYQSWILTIREHFPDCLEQDTCNGRPRAKIRDEFLHVVPSEYQFRYIARLISEQENLVRRKPNAVCAERPRNANKGSARRYANLVGEYFQADATKLQVRVVSSWDRSQTLRPLTLYSAVDVASTAVVGWLLSPDAPSTALALRLIRQCGTSKRAELERLGIEFCEDEWTAELPSNTHADRGEWVSKKCESLVRGGVAIKVGKAYTPNTKGCVEKTHDLLKNKIAAAMTPGVHKRRVERCDDDGFATAALNFSEINRLVIEKIRDINLAPAPEDVIPPQMVVEGITDFSRISIYKWKAENEPGMIRRVSEKQAFEYFLQSVQGRVTSRGIRYDGHVYESDVLHDLGITLKAARGRATSFEIFIEEQLPSFAWFKHPESDEMVQARCHEPVLEELKIAYWEWADYNKQLEMGRKSTKFTAENEAAKRSEGFDAVIKNAKKSRRADVAASGKSKTALKNGRREASQKESKANALDYERTLRDKQLILVSPSQVPNSPISKPQLIKNHENPQELFGVRPAMALEAARISRERFKARALS